MHRTGAEPGDVAGAHTITFALTTGWSVSLIYIPARWGSGLIPDSGVHWQQDPGHYFLTGKRGSKGRGPV